MPNYDYKCTLCDYTFEVFQNMTDTPIEICPKCEGKVKRLIGSGAGPIFKGSGFYQTDYKGNGKSKSENKSSNTAPTQKSENTPKTVDSTKSTS
ncbi:MAG TPA: zinc ribbon domain-containing protein [Ignavibacteriaceae bacterium]|nr:zinc ribbon domain-containing protein [Ignavibacteriaceae bacterium]